VPLNPGKRCPLLFGRPATILSPATFLPKYSKNSTSAHYFVYFACTIFVLIIISRRQLWLQAFPVLLQDYSLEECLRNWTARRPRAARSFVSNFHGPASIDNTRVATKVAKNKVGKKTVKHRRRHHGGWGLCRQRLDRTDNSGMSQFLHLSVWFNFNASKLG